MDLTLLNNAKAKPLGLRKWSEALKRVRNGTGNARILCVGDSTTAVCRVGE